MPNTLYTGDLPDSFDTGDTVAIDTEAMGLRFGRDRLCLVQISTGDGCASFVQIRREQSKAPNLQKILENRSILKIFHFARFDVALLYQTFGVLASPVYCTKIASKIARTYTNQHGLSALVAELLNLEISKEKQSSDWGSGELSEAQLQYAANDVLYLHRIRSLLDRMLEREGRADLAASCFEFLPTRARLDIGGWPEDIFAH
ncbi:MAG: ribonuclease D [Albidovulum sp.]|nr:ribonuclease D [Albidovulum sp.]